MLKSHPVILLVTLNGTIELYRFFFHRMYIWCSIWSKLLCEKEKYCQLYNSNVRIFSKFLCLLECLTIFNCKFRYNEKSNCKCHSRSSTRKQNRKKKVLTGNYFSR
uniref:Uncharacterized protein n=1 Tax=Anguilla anguilla TaxID=7936 RepID=A0A0E9X3E9_ANGAN